MPLRAQGGAHAPQSAVSRAIREDVARKDGVEKPTSISTGRPQLPRKRTRDIARQEPRDLGGHAARNAPPSQAVRVRISVRGEVGKMTEPGWMSRHECEVLGCHERAVVLILGERESWLCRFHADHPAVLMGRSKAQQQEEKHRMVRWRDKRKGFHQNLLIMPGFSTLSAKKFAPTENGHLHRRQR